MKSTILMMLIICTLVSSGQQITIFEWNQAAKNDKRLLPKFGYQSKSADEIMADKELIEFFLKEGYTLRKASEAAISEGVGSLENGNAAEAMFRFNQAFLLDSTNSDIYWGYGLVYQAIGLGNEADYQIRQGILRDPSNAKLFALLGTIFLEKYGKHKAELFLDSAFLYADKAYRLDRATGVQPMLLEYYLKKGDCGKAKEIYEECIHSKKINLPGKLKKEYKNKCD